MKYLILFIIILLMPLNVAAESPVSGYVYNQYSRLVSGALIAFISEGAPANGCEFAYGTFTDDKGNYVIDLPDCVVVSDKVVIRAVKYGYETKEMVVSGDYLSYFHYLSLELIQLSRKAIYIPLVIR